MTQEVFLLSYTKYGDHDAVLHCFCRENGFESFFAKGIYAPKNKKKAFLFPLNELLLYTSDKKKSIQNVQKIEQKNIDLFSSDIRKNSILFFISDLLNQVLRNENQNVGIYSEISIFLSQLQIDNFQSHLIFIFRLLKQQGLQPLFSDKTFLNPETGNFEDIEMHHFFDKTISDIWKDLITSQDPYSIKLSRAEKQNFLDSILVYFHYHFTDFREPRSLEIIKEIF
ncbi:recombination protein O N-terminal domain-containing protein [Epilithonimonas ginsengisoli]|uniref:Recombination protein O N-terminal domain-containing protein n=1 Tax=Epilithonimonas ginsengisoli TaxID=1245592 RepID=A0ABU4JCH0_9FLAO|nr:MULTISPECIES: recombination protein O N-terminal domain-containing protein [Chryseobacterium group]MBV6878393.1 recombination protein O N-terminal domain-containing protein [Epilithonimonas sp. FP105]MDW8547364.1 recombination protein O N-terminal domain-containing protein [Epilithonimonas ginsengisoli]OAH69039.1 DNA repair protein RecO [Chryseobacterium sp. FP211-J200]